MIANMLTWIRRLCKKAAKASGLQPTQERLEEAQVQEEADKFLALQRARKDEEKRLEHIRQEIEEKDERLKSIIEEKHSLQQLLVERQAELYNLYDTSNSPIYAGADTTGTSFYLFPLCLGLVRVSNPLIFSFTG